MILITKIDREKKKHKQFSIWSVLSFKTVIQAYIRYISQAFDKVFGIG